MLLACEHAHESRSNQACDDSVFHILGREWDDPSGQWGSGDLDRPGCVRDLPGAG